MPVNTPSPVTPDPGFREYPHGCTPEDLAAFRALPLGTATLDELLAAAPAALVDTTRQALADPRGILDDAQFLLGLILLDHEAASDGDETNLSAQDVG